MADDKAPTYRLAYLANFQHFAPGGAYDLALYLGRQLGELGDQGAADMWFSVAAANAAGMHPPNAIYCGRVSGALKAMAAALQTQAERIDREIAEHALAMENSSKAAVRKRLEAQGQARMAAAKPKPDGDGLNA